MAEKTPCFRRCSTSKVASPNQEGVERTDSEDVWMITDPSAILFIGASLMKGVVFFFLKEAHFCRYSLEVTSRCASRGLDGVMIAFDPSGKSSQFHGRAPLRSYEPVVEPPGFPQLDHQHKVLPQPIEFL
jgi:hypothetical protein